VFFVVVVADKAQLLDAAAKAGVSLKDVAQSPSLLSAIE
jgi:hypothetical protein